MESDGLTGERLVSARRGVGLSQRALAAQLGVTVRTVQNYEAGRSVPYRHLDTLSRVLERPRSWLLYGHEHSELAPLLASSRQERDRLKRNLERLDELRHQLADTAASAQPPRPGDSG